MSTITVTGLTYKAVAIATAYSNSLGVTAADAERGWVTFKADPDLLGYLDEVISDQRVEDAMLLEGESPALRALAELRGKLTNLRAVVSPERCPKTGRSASACDTADHTNCPDLEGGR